ncbi:MAG: CinA family protein [Actinomycetota bacterium]|nr:CinA family protein [Actinomycetota bacterium]
MTSPDQGATALVAACRDAGLTVATGESVTAGLLAATVAEVPGASAVLRGAVVAYHVDVKRALLDVPASALAQGVVSRAVAEAMAAGAARRVAADVGIGTTGVAGPDPHDGEPVGSVWIAACGPGWRVSEHLRLPGGRDEVRCQTVQACLTMVTVQVLAMPGAVSPNAE